MTWLDADPYAENVSHIRQARERLEEMGEGARVDGLAGCFHAVRLCAHGVRDRTAFARSEARNHYPPSPEDGASDPSTWPTWRVARLARWKDECEEVDRRFGVGAADAAAYEVDELLDDIVTRVEHTPPRTVEEANDKLWVLLWHYDAIIPGLEPLGSRPLWRAADQLGELIAEAAPSVCSP